MPTDKTAQWLQNRRDEIRNADYSDACADSILDFLDAYNPDNLRLKPPLFEGNDEREDTLSTSSRLSYASTLHRTAQHMDLTECTASDLNRLAQQRLDGTHESVDDDGVNQNTVHQNQVAWRAYARFHNNHPDGHDINVDADDITLVNRGDSTVDERDMFEAAEIQAMRDATTNKRDRSLLEMLIYTGQRHNALRMLKVKDVKPAEGNSGTIYIPDGEGMKGADGKRPLLGAQKSAREWKQAHPTKEPDDAFFTHIYDWSGHESIEPGDHLSRNAFGRITKRIADRAGVDKPTNPHQFRHYFVTMAISKHDLSFDTVRYLIGHTSASRELERTYQHLVDEDYIESAEADMGIREEKERSATPSVCPQCDEPLQPHYDVCPNCQYTFSAKVEQLKDQVERMKTEGALASANEKERDDIRTFLNEIDDPQFFDQLLSLADSVDVDSVEDVAARLSR